MNSKMRSLIALFMVIAVAGVYSFGLQTMRGYAGEEATGQTTGSQSEQDVDAEQDAPSSAADETGGGTDAGGPAKAVKGADKAGEDGNTVVDAKGGDGAGEDGAGDETGVAEDEVIDMTGAVETGDFKVLGDESAYTFDPETGVLTITGDAVVSMKEGVTSTNQRIVVADDATVTIQDISIQAEGAPAIKINAPVNAGLILKGDNKVLGGNGNNVNHISGSYAGVEIEWESHENMASLTISGSGKLEAVGGPNSAAIGGSKSHNGVYGNITIESGTIVAKSGETSEWAGGAGIGSSDNPNNGTSSGSYKHTNDSWGVITINGGNITAVGGSNAAGIGGGNHCDSGEIVINGGTIDAKGHTGIGSGYGSSQTTNTTDKLTKGPGYYYADITITGGNITAEAYSTGSTNDGGSGIGGGMYSDAKITITGGTITSKGGNGKNTDTEVKSYHHGGSGIGGGYEGHAEITITGGTITAIGGGASAGIGSGSIPNSNPSNTGSQGYKSRLGETTCEYTDIEIGGEAKITATGGSSGGAGIGGGVGADKVAINITGGDIAATGGKGSEDKLKYRENGSPYAGGNGGAGIGSGYSGTTSGESAKYFTTTDSLEVSITGGTVLAIGGWGASGIGSGADNTTATSITIDVNNAKIEAYADGTKFAIDTRDLEDDGMTESITEGRTITGDVLQGTFVHEYNQPVSGGADIHQGTEGLGSIKIINDKTGEQKELTQMPDGYRSFATDVNGEGAYTVFSDDSAISNGNGRYFNRCIDDTRSPEEIESDSDILERNVQYMVNSNGLCDNFYLFPVKTVVVEKIVQGTNTGGLNMTAYFCLKAGNGFAHRPGEDNIWTESIEIVNGVPQTKAYFINVDDNKYDVWEIKGENDTTSPKGESFGSYTLTKITTQHGEAVALPLGTTHDDSRGITYTVAQDGDELTITASMDTDKRQGDHSVTLSLFADGVLTEYPSKKLNAAEGWEQTWTEIPASKNGTLIQYSVADTSNNAQIDDDIWNDEVKIINSYKQKAAELVITKELPKFIDHINGNETITEVNATFFFEITGTYDDGKPYQNTAGIDFNRNSDKVQTVTVALPSDIADLEVKEVYAGNYKLDPDQDPPEVVQTADGVYTVKFTNVVSDYEYKGGITNKYELDGGISKLIGTTTNPQQP